MQCARHREHGRARHPECVRGLDGVCCRRCRLRGALCNALEAFYSSLDAVSLAELTDDTRQQFAIADDVEGVVILNGKTPHAVLLELFTDHGAGTLIRP